MSGAHGHLVSSRMPGVVFIGVPMQAAFAWTHWDAMAPSVITASVATAAAVANVTLLFRRMTAAAPALVGGALLAFGTPLWTVAGAELWTHGPDVLWLSAGLLALASGRVALSGLLFAPALLTRPHLAISVAAIGVVVAWGRRSVRVLPLLGVPAAAALGLVVIYNWYLFGTVSLSAGSYSYASHAAIAGNGSTLADSLRNWGDNTAGILFSPMRGLIPYAPVVLLALFAIRAAWRQLPDWGRGAAVGGILYLLLQARIDGIYSSTGFYGSRLAIESALLWAPLVFLAGRALWRNRRRGPVLAICAASVLVELAGAAFGRVMTVSLNADPWRTWLPYEVSRSGGPRVLLVDALSLALTALVAIRLLFQRPTQAAPRIDDHEPTRHGEALNAPMFNRDARTTAKRDAARATPP